MVLCEPVCAQHGHDDGVDLLPVEDECRATAAFDDEPGALVYMLCRGLKAKTSSSMRYKIRGGKGVRQEQPRRLGAQAPITPARTDENAKIAGLVLGLPGVQDGFPTHWSLARSTMARS
ncbi:MAG TPA: hypothetical protein VNA67_05910, partial [Pseudonocardiaceae bacterium]|nr:hypothetical protein [Pseudonocardiaceae bacterium]